MKYDSQRDKKLMTR